MLDVRFTPQMTIQHLLTQRGIQIEDIGVAPVVMLTWSRKLVDDFAAQIGAELSPHWLYSNRLFNGVIDGHPISMVHAAVGAPGTALVMEELVACGARNFVGLGWAGSLQPQAPLGSLLIPRNCIREEGTSLHYYPGEVSLTSDPTLAGILQQTAQEAGMQALEGLHWTTDAPYRETITKIEAYRQQGVLGVDMETSAMFAIGLYRQVRVANLLVVSDELWQEWNPGFRTPQLIAASEQAKLIVERSLVKISQLPA